MKKILLSLILLLPALVADAQGPIKLWNDQLDKFITAFNEVDPALNQLYSDNVISVFAFTYYDPESGDVIKEASVFDSDAFGKINDDLMAKAREIVVKGLVSQSGLTPILKEFEKKNTDIVLLYTTESDGKKLTKQVKIAPSEIK